MYRCNSTLLLYAICSLSVNPQPTHPHTHLDSSNSPGSLSLELFHDLSTLSMPAIFSGDSFQLLLTCARHSLHVTTSSLISLTFEPCQRRAKAMGVKELWGILGAVREERPLSALSGRRLAVDLSGWVCEAQTAKVGGQNEQHSKFH